MISRGLQFNQTSFQCGFRRRLQHDAKPLGPNVKCETAIYLIYLLHRQNGKLNRTPWSKRPCT